MKIFTKSSTKSTNGSRRSVKALRKAHKKRALVNTVVNTVVVADDASVSSSTSLSSSGSEVDAADLDDESEVEEETDASSEPEIAADVLNELTTKSNIVQYFTSTHGGERSLYCATAIAKQLISCLMFLHFLAKSSCLHPTYLFQFFILFLEEHYKDLYRFTNHLESERGLKPSTIKNYITNIHHACNWFVLFSTIDVPLPRLPSSILAGVKEAVSMIGKSLAKLIKKHRRDGKSLEQLTLKGKIPPGGLTDLQNAVLQIMNRLSNVDVSNISRELFNFLKGLALAAMYCLSAQGRIKAILFMSNGLGTILTTN